MECEHMQISFSDPINTTTAKGFIGLLKEICVQYPDTQNLTINISSPGGDVDVAIELFYFLRNLDCEIQTVNTSYVNSAAILLFLAGDVRICHSGSTFYIHSIHKRLKGNYNAQMLEREMKEIVANTDVVTTLLEQRTQKSKRYWKGLMQKGCILKAGQAIKYGLASVIIDN